MGKGEVLSFITQMFLEWLMFHRHFLSHNFRKTVIFFGGDDSKHLFSLFFLLEIGESYVAYRFFGSFFLVNFLVHLKHLGFSGPRGGCFWRSFWTTLDFRALTLVGAYEVSQLGMMRTGFQKWELMSLTWRVLQLQEIFSYCICLILYPISI